MPSDLPTPKRIAAALSRFVIGQKPALHELSIALSKKLAGLDVGNVLMIGSSGTGKTTLMRAVEKYLEQRPELSAQATVIRMHANVLGEEAIRGRPGEAILSRLLERARDQLGPQAGLDELVARASHGMVFVDEVDKIRSRVGDRPNTAGIRAQEALLTVIENEAVPVAMPAWAGGGTRVIDSSRILFVCAGAFEGLWDSVFDRVTVGDDRGALRPRTVIEDGVVEEVLDFHLRDWLRNRDLFDYGMSPQFLSRFDSVVLLSDLTVEELARIFVEIPDSGYRQARDYFGSHGIDLALSPGAIRRIALEASREGRLGARSLREVFRRVIRGYEFELDQAANGPDGSILLDVAEVEDALAEG